MTGFILFDIIVYPVKYYYFTINNEDLDIVTFISYVKNIDGSLKHAIRVNGIMYNDISELDGLPYSDDLTFYIRNNQLVLI